MRLSSVTLVEAELELMRGDVITDRISYLERLQTQGVQVLTGSRVVGLRGGGVVLEDGRELAAERIVAAVGRVSERGDAEALRAVGIAVHVVGDALRPGRIHDAVHSAYLTARRL